MEDPAPGEDAGRAERGRNGGAAPGRPGWRLLPIGVGAMVAAAFLLILVLAHPEIRAWLRLNLYLPTVARMLGRDTLLADGVAIATGPGPYVTLGIAGAYALTLLLIRALLISHGRAGGRRLGEHIRIDSSLAFAVLPFVALAAVIETLAVTQLFRVPWAFAAVPPILVHLIALILVLSLVFALWIENGGTQHHRVRYLLVVLLFLVIGLFWMAVMQGTTRRLPWWIPPATLLVALIVYHSVTLAGRIVSHRRALFSIGCLHLAFFAGFLAVWFIEGPWPVMEWRFAGQGALRTIHNGDALLLVLTLGVPALIAVGALTIGQFLHTYSRWAHVWVDGLNVVALFAQTLDGWVHTLAAHDPYDAFSRTEAPIGPIAAWATGLLGGWGYFWGKLILALVLITLIYRHPRLRRGRGAEIRTLLITAIAAVGLAQGLVLGLRLAAGV